MYGVIHGPGIEEDRLYALHEFLRARGGWELGEFADEDENGYPNDPEACWEYVSSFGGDLPHQVDDVAMPARCCFSFNERGGVQGVQVESAGTWQGCDQHDVVEYQALDQDGATHFASLAALLDRVESQARQLDVRVLIECRYFGECGYSC